MSWKENKKSILKKKERKTKRKKDDRQTVSLSVRKAAKETVNVKRDLGVQH